VAFGESPWDSGGSKRSSTQVLVFLNPLQIYYLEQLNFCVAWHQHGASIFLSVAVMIGANLSVHHRIVGRKEIYGKDACALHSDKQAKKETADSNIKDHDFAL
jgi:hypothetical protein